MDKKILKKSLLIIPLILGVSVISACDDTSSSIDVKSVFEFTGKGTINEVDYDFAIKGVEADNEFYIEVLNTEFEHIFGEWKFTTGKGYILTFDDAYWTEKKVKYNEENKQFYFSYDVNLGSAYGKTRVKFTGSANDFEYDGIGWGFEPFEFSVVGADVFGMTTLDASLTCYEDLSFKTTGSCPLIAVPERKGTYVFDKDTNVYTFIFTDQSDPVVSTYEESTNSYSIVVKFNVGMSMPFTLTYMAE